MTSSLTGAQRISFVPSLDRPLSLHDARIAVRSWLTARQSGGSLQLRFADTASEPVSPAFQAEMEETLGWLGIDWDGSPVLHSANLPRHQAALDGLLKSGAAYYCQDGKDEVDAYRDRYGSGVGFRGTPSSAGAVRLRVPAGSSRVEDVLKGGVTFENEHLGEPVIARSDGSLMERLSDAVETVDAAITLSFRPERLICQTPYHQMMITALGGKLPLYTHHPMVDYSYKMEPIQEAIQEASVAELRAEGYLPESLFTGLPLLAGT